MFKAGLRFPFSALHHRLPQYLGLVVTQISPNTWRVFIGTEVLYGVLRDRERRMTVKELFHCYCPSEIFQSRGLYSFLPRKTILRLVFDTPDSNKNWRSRYFFMQGDNWICRPDDQEFMLVDKTWGIVPPSGNDLSLLNFVFCLLSLSNCPVLFTTRDHPPVTLE